MTSPHVLTAGGRRPHNITRRHAQDTTTRHPQDITRRRHLNDRDASDHRLKSTVKLVVPRRSQNCYVRTPQSLLISLGRSQGWLVHRKTQIVTIRWQLWRCRSDCHVLKLSACIGEWHCTETRLMVLTVTAVAVSTTIVERRSRQQRRNTNQQRWTECLRIRRRVAMNENALCQLVTGGGPVMLHALAAAAAAVVANIAVTTEVNLSRQRRIH